MGDKTTTKYDWAASHEKFGKGDRDGRHEHFGKRDEQFHEKFGKGDEKSDMSTRAHLMFGALFNGFLIFGPSSMGS
jgi:hypothetical protein